MNFLTLPLVLTFFTVLDTFSCSHPRSPHRSSRKQRSNAEIDNTSQLCDPEDVLDEDSLGFYFLFDEMLPNSYYETLSDQLTSLFGKLNLQGYFADLIYNCQTTEVSNEQEEKFKSTDEFKNYLLHVDEPVKTFPKSLKKQFSNKILRPLQVIPQMTLTNLQETFIRQEAAKFLNLLSAVGPYYSPSILEYLKDPSTPDLSDFFSDSAVDGAATFVPLHYLKKEEYELFHAFMLKYKFKPIEFHDKILYELISFCLKAPFEVLETIFKTQPQVLTGIEISLFELLLKESAFPAIRLYFKLVPSDNKSPALFSVIVNSSETSAFELDQNTFALYLSTIPELEVNSLVRIKADQDAFSCPVILGVLYKKHQFLFYSLLLHPKIDLNGEFEFIHVKPMAVSDFKWPNLPLHLHALLLFEFRKFWEIAVHPLYRHNLIELKHFLNILLIIYYLIVMKFQQ